MARLVFAHYDVFVLAGNLRAMLMLADTAKFMGYDIVFLFTNIRPREAWYWGPGELTKYHPVKYLEFPPCRVEPGERCGDFQAEDHRYLHIRLYDWMMYEDNYLTYIEDEPRLLWLGPCCERLAGVHYAHYPDRPVAPKAFKVYAFNSTYTADLAAYWWGVRGEVVYPPLWTDMYISREWDDRDIDVVFFGQMYRVKGFNLAEKLAKMGYRVAIVGAKVGDWKPSSQENIELYPNATLEEYRDILSRSRVYVHARPGEHFGITITEAMASGTPAIVHRSGGQWMDIAEGGRYAMGWTTVDELIKRVTILARKRIIWETWHIRALNRAVFFDARNMVPRLRKVIEQAAWLRRRA